MSKKQHPFLPMFVGDFMAATGEWEGEEQALYALLLMHQWALGHLPIETPKLARLAKYDPRNFERWWPTVSTKFELREVEGFGDRLLNLRLEQHRAKSLALSEKNAQAGKLGAERKWRKDGERHQKPMASVTRLGSERHKSANGVTDGNPSHPIPSHPDPSEKHSVADLNGSDRSPGADAPAGLASKVLPDAPEGNGREASRPKGTRIPDGFALTAERRAVAEAERIDPERTFATFTDYWRAKAGAGGTKLDWDATWRNWCRKEADTRAPRKSASAADRITWRPTE
jgi:uncharacterized protein YdaU (DUF1376 family)